MAAEGTDLEGMLLEVVLREMLLVADLQGKVVLQAHLRTGPMPVAAARRSKVGLWETGSRESVHRVEGSPVEQGGLLGVDGMPSDQVHLE